MSDPRQCPVDILALFDDEETKPEGRKCAVEWAKAQLATMAEGGTILMPDPETGELSLTRKDSGFNDRLRHSP